MTEDTDGATRPAHSQRETPTPDADDPPIDVGVVGVGTMGARHARVYHEHPGARLVGVADADADRARTVAGEYGTRARERDALFEAADAVSVAVPTRFHHETALAAIEAGVDTLVEKPLVADLSAGRELVARADEAGVTLQVGHVERFNPAIRTLEELADGLDVVAVAADRLGPPPERELREGVVLDLMIHDLDVLRALVGDDLSVVGAAATRDDQYATATLRGDDGTVARLTASRMTQQKVRTLSVTAADCRINVDYLGQSVRIHRRSVPEYVEHDGTVGYRHESIIEESTVENGEPLKAELSSFLDAARTGADPVVTGEDGLRAVELARAVERATGDETTLRPAAGGGS